VICEARFLLYEFIRTVKILDIKKVTVKTGKVEALLSCNASERLEKRETQTL